MKVKVWQEKVCIPTYEVGKPEKNPVFLEKRVYQGSSGVVYPYPVIEKVEDHPVDKEYNGVFLENEYLKIMVLPELGGRVQMAYDKLKKRHFIYYNRVIKPALVGLAGPWISGGIEFNWPQHHRPSTFLPVDYELEERSDGSAVIWVSERERMFHQKGMAGFVLYPGRAYLEICVNLYNPTPFPQTFLWWANPAVAVNDAYQSVFPGDVNAVFDHGKRDVSSYPIARGVYYKVDYSAGVDISRYRNIPVPTSYMAIHSDFDFVGGYEHDTRAGVLHVANHHISPGKKQWTWGNGDFGRAWDRNLTDEDGPYIELMTGVYTDNQPDFSWLQPYEEKSFSQYFIPYRELGMVKNATCDLLMNLDMEEEKGYLKLLATFRQENLRVELLRQGEVCWGETVTLTPEEIWIRRMDLPDWRETEVRVRNEAGKVILAWKVLEEEEREIPQPARPALLPEEVESVEQLFLTGQHLEQYRHATFNPVDYYEEGLRRDVSDIRCNNAMGLWLLRKGQFVRAEKYLRRAVKTITQYNPNPYDGEPLYNLGMSLKYQERDKEAYDCFYKACWNAAWQDAGYFSLAQLSVKAGKWEDALYEVDKSLLRNVHNHKARHLKMLILRKLGRRAEAVELAEESLQIDLFNFGCLYEWYLVTGDEERKGSLEQRMRYESRNYEELILDYADCGCWEEAVRVAELAMRHCPEISEMVGYYEAWCLLRLGEKERAVRQIQDAEKSPLDSFFPNHPDALLALQAVVDCVPTAARAFYHLGNIWYDKRQYAEAVEAWENTLVLDRNFPTVQRNLALACFNKLGRKKDAVRFMEEAFHLDTTDARILMELDQLYRRMNYSSVRRLEILDSYRTITFSRDDLYLSYVTLLNQVGRSEEALELIKRRRFHPWEGGEGKVPEQYQWARLALCEQYLALKEYAKALEQVDACYFYPENLGEGKLPGACEHDFDYYKACILDASGRNTEAIALWEKAAGGDIPLTAAMYYNDQKPDKLFYRGLALRKLGREAEACGCFRRLVDFGETHLDEKFRMDYFAVSLPELQIWEEDMEQRNRVHCLYLMSLGYVGLGDEKRAEACLREVLSLDGSHSGALAHWRRMHS